MLLLDTIAYGLYEANDIHERSNQIGQDGIMEGTTRSEAFRQAKRDAGIPVSQEPLEVNSVKLEENGRTAIGSDGLPIMTREYVYKTPNGNIVIQEHSAGHQFGEGGVGDQGPHFNVRPEGDPRANNAPGTLEHYPFDALPIPRIEPPIEPIP